MDDDREAAGRGAVAFAPASVQTKYGKRVENLQLMDVSGSRTDSHSTTCRYVTLSALTINGTGPDSSIQFSQDGNRAIETSRVGSAGSIDRLSNRAVVLFKDLSRLLPPCTLHRWLLSCEIVGNITDADAAYPLSY